MEGIFAEMVLRSPVFNILPYLRFPSLRPITIPAFNTALLFRIRDKYLFSRSELFDPALCFQRIQFTVRFGIMP